MALQGCCNAIFTMKKLVVVMEYLETGLLCMVLCWEDSKGCRVRRPRLGMNKCGLLPHRWLVLSPRHYRRWMCIARQCLWHFGWVRLLLSLHLNCWRWLVGIGGRRINMNDVSYSTIDVPTNEYVYIFQCVSPISIRDVHYAWVCRPTNSQN